MKHKFVLYSILLLFACNTNSQEIPDNVDLTGDFSFLKQQTKNSPSKKLFDPVKVDDKVSTFGFRSLNFEDYDKKYVEGTTQIREFDTFEHWTDEIKVVGKDTLYFNFEIRFNESGQVTYMNDGRHYNEFKYDSDGNLLFRKLYSSEDDKSTIDRIFYDSFGNLRSYYQYTTLADSSCQFIRFSKYNYIEKSDKVVAEIKTVEKWTDFHTSSRTKEFDPSGQFITEYVEEYSPLQLGRKKFKTIYEYDDSGTKLLSETMTQPNNTQASHKKSFSFDMQGRLVEEKSVMKNLSLFDEYKTVKHYQDNTLAVTEYFNSNSPKHEKTELGHRKTEVFEFDKQGNPIAIKECGVDSVFTDGSMHQYQYDDQGNWTSQKSKYIYFEEKGTGYDVDETLFSVREVNYSLLKDTSTSKIKPDLKAEKLLVEILNKHGH